MKEPFDYSLSVAKIQRKMKEVEKLCLEGCVRNRRKDFNQIYMALADICCETRGLMEWADMRSELLDERSG